MAQGVPKWHEDSLRLLKKKLDSRAKQAIEYLYRQRETTPAPPDQELRPMPTQPPKSLPVPTYAQTRAWLFNNDRAREDRYAVPFAALANQVATVHSRAEELAELRHKHLTTGEPVELAKRTQYALRQHLANSVGEVCQQVPKTRMDFARHGAAHSRS